MALYLLERVWTGDRLERRVLLEEQEGRIADLRALGEAPPPPGARMVSGLTLPGLVNAHSHAFHRALRGRAEGRAGRTGDFWSWRQSMYRVASRLEPEAYFHLARAVYGEMALAGITAVGEFHYVHHRPDGSRYPGPEMERALAEAALEAGIRLTILDTCYLRSGFGGRELEPAQLRFSDGTAKGWRRRMERREDLPGVVVGAAIHSVRAVDAEGIRVVAGWASEHRAPLHLHLSEQLQENRDCRAATGRSPTELLASLGTLGKGTTAVHGIHLSPTDIRLLGTTGTRVCVCPTTERDLGDGICPARHLADAGVRLCLGSDSHAVIDLFEEARALELDQRLRRHRRAMHQPAELLAAATRGGALALGWDSGDLAAGRLADFVSLDDESPRMAGMSDLDPAAQVIYAAHPSDVVLVVVGGKVIVDKGEHQRLGRVGSLLASAQREVLA